MCAEHVWVIQNPVLGDELKGKTQLSVIYFPPRVFCDYEIRRFYFFFNAPTRAQQDKGLVVVTGRSQEWTHTNTL